MFGLGVGGYWTLMDNKTIRKEPASKQRRRKRELYLCQVYPVRSRPGRPLPFVRVGSGVQVGREPRLDSCLRVADGTVSRCHFSVVETPLGWRVEDEESANGTYLNGRRVRRAEVFPQDILRAGNALFVLSSGPVQDLSWLHQHDMVAASSMMAQVTQQARTAAGDKGNVLILGETGTGKELLAALVHSLSRRKGKYLQVNCGAIPEALVESTLFGHVRGAFTGSDQDRAGLLVEARGGTLLLDEIGELAPATQVKLLRALEDRQVLPVGATQPIPFDVKILAATNQLEALQNRDSTFRQDLLGRLEDIVLYLPPLRQRREELALLVVHTLEGQGLDADKVLTSEFMEAALVRDWPRNTRQLVKAVRAATKRLQPGESLHRDDLSERLRWETAAEREQTPGGLGRPRQADYASEPPITPSPLMPEHNNGPPTAEQLRIALGMCDNNISAVARYYDCDRKQIYRWLKQHEIPRQDNG